jgi:ornithine cyclodeaminase/alanine dehydrogenase
MPEQSPHFVSSDVVERVISWDDVIAQIRKAYSVPHAESVSPPRTVARDAGQWLRTLTAVPPGARYMGAKLFGIGRRRTLQYVVVLIEQETGEIAGFVDANLITAYRTAATSAVAVDLLAGTGPQVMGLLGSGAEAQSHLRAIARVRNLKTVHVFSPTPEKREAFAQRFTQELGVECRAVSSAEEAVAGSDIVVAAARSRNEEPILFGRWLRPGMLVVSIGSTLPEQREIDSSVVAACDLIVCDVVDEVIAETGDMLATVRDGIEFKSKIVSLNQLVSSPKMDRAAKPSLPLFKSVGSALQDLAVAELVFDKACTQGLATSLPIRFLTKGRGLREKT